MSSDFSRAVETAEAIVAEVNSFAVMTDARLRERFFGALELTSSDNYSKVWAEDLQSSAHTAFGVESGRP